MKIPSEMSPLPREKVGAPNTPRHSAITEAESTKQRRQMYIRKKITEMDTREKNESREAQRQESILWDGAGGQ